MRIEAKVEVLKGHHTLLRYADPWYKPSGAKLNKDGSCLTIWQNIRIMRRSDVIEELGLHPDDALADWYICLAFSKSVDIPSDVFLSKGKKHAYAYPINPTSMRVDGQPIIPPSFNLITTEEIKPRSVKVYPGMATMDISFDALSVATHTNYNLLSTFYIRRMERRLQDMGYFEEFASDVWSEPDEYTFPLARSLGRLMYILVKNTKAVNHRGIMELIHQEYKSLLNKRDPDSKHRVDIYSADPYAHPGETPEEQARRERFEAEVLAAEAELRGLGIEELKRTMKNELKIASESSQ